MKNIKIKYSLYAGGAMNALEEVITYIDSLK